VRIFYAPNRSAHAHGLLTPIIIPGTYTNIENHPRLIRVRDVDHVPRIRLDPKTGLPALDIGPKSKPRRDDVENEVHEGEDNDSEADRAKQGNFNLMAWSNR
jgi:hypothetical protein